MNASDKIMFGNQNIKEDIEEKDIFT